ncbi:HlyD family efflux transporter periplasmic adaptor subunit (plasmid) [Skermanella mucosa]|uniref:HlyD family secretion protein n=1 Tax=Skermanella mucosa TaxID=1789672 RepID=UPI00192B78E9|nr:HlyD family efflux transporter periplasmic adaptor subunit [Skermanella mucosa]UEM24915.1 HlyD family efflux transporter periplasmic adaptor subunit [Skermanella mucosa]
MRAAPLLALLAVVGIAAGGYAYWDTQQSRALPAGLASANGRIEVERVDIATKLAGRVAEIHVREGDAVKAGDIVARMDVTELQAQLLAAKAAVRRAVEGIGKAEAEVSIREAEQQLSEVELRRVVELERRAAVSTAEVDRRRAQNEVAKAQILGARAAVRDAKAAREAAEAQVAQIEATIADMTLKTPVSGRVEYRLARAGEVLGAGGRVVTVLDLTDVFMTIFLPTGQAGRVAHGSEARIVLDAAPSYVVPATVSFIAAEAQFTPKAVETSDEREKLMYRVKLAIDPKLLETYRDYVRAGLTGNAYVRIDRAAEWPAELAPKLPPTPEGAETADVR